MANRFVVDITPLRESSRFRRLYFGHSLSYLGRELTVVAVPYQVYVLTGSTLAVGALGIVQLVPLLLVSLIGGAVVDAVDRRKVLVWSQLGLAVTAAGLAVNAALPSPAVWPLYVLTGLNAALSAFGGPARMAALPTVLPRRLLASGFALNQTISEVASAVGPALAGFLIARFSLTLSYSLESLAFLLGAVAMVGIGPLRPEGGGQAVSLSSILEGLRYLKGERLIQACFLIDINAMVFGMPRALFPAIGTGLFGGDASTVGLLYAAPGVGALVAAVTSGWVAGVGRRGRVVVAAVVAWGLSIALFGIVGALPLALLLLAIAGGADVVSAVFRNTILQLTVPDRLRGRLSAVHGAVVGGGPHLGDVESGTVAALTSLRFSVVSGGIACVLGAFAIARFMPELWNYRDEAVAAD